MCFLNLVFLVIGHTFVDRIERDCVAEVSSIRTHCFVTRKLKPS